MTPCVKWFLAGMLASFVALAPAARTAVAAEPQSRITILYDAFGKDASMKKDWGFSALVEVAGKRILFDTGNDRDTFAANVKAKGVDLTNLDFVIVSHRHSDHMAGLSYVFERKSECEDLCAQGGLRHFWLVSAVELLSEGRVVAPEMRYYGGTPPEVMQFGTAWQDANFELHSKLYVFDVARVEGLSAFGGGREDCKIKQGRYLTTRGPVGVKTLAPDLRDSVPVHGKLIECSARTDEGSWGHVQQSNGASGARSV